MDKRLNDILTGKEGNHLLPFFWMHDGRHEVLTDIVQSIYDSGARAFCVESRPHENFCRDEWWYDMDLLIDEAQKRDMKVWILDDKHFPTGYANGLVPEKYPQHRKWHLVENHVDVVGPAPESALLLAVKPSDEEILIGAYAYKRNDHAQTLSAEYIDLTANVQGDYLYWDVPEGVYRVFFLYQSRRGTNQTNYIHLIDPDSVKVLIKAVYEPHFEHYGEHFGKTIAGFFSDEPSFGNQNIARGVPYLGMYAQMLGQPGLALPWNEEALRRMSEKLGTDAKPLLAGLWYKQGEGMPEVRVAYMDTVTEMWKENFSYQLGNWCREHGVEYIGHVIEDMNGHMRLSCSGGHFFRSLDGQDMAGIDVVLHQIMPGMSQHMHTAICSGGYTDPEFFDNTLARLAASHSHINPRMKNRAMCEVFGAYGWAEGVPFMKYLMDHMLVRGINHFVPHAFSPKYPDPDCPPHFNAGGFNPQFEGFSKLMNYTNKVAHLLEGGNEIVSAAILYNAEAEWAGKDYMLMQKPAKKLYDQQLNYDFLPTDAMLNDAAVADGKLTVNGMVYPAMIVPYSQYLPAALIEKLADLEKAGMKLAFVTARPDGCDCGDVIELDGVVDYVRAAGGTDVKLAEENPYLRMAHYRREGADVFMFVNESMMSGFCGEIALPVSGKGTYLDILGDDIKAIEAIDGKVCICLEKAQSCMLVFGGDVPEGLAPYKKAALGDVIEAKWTLALKQAQHDADYSEAKPIEALYNVCGPKGDPDFSGWMKYEGEFELNTAAAGIDLGVVGECVHAWLDGEDLGVRVTFPYAYEKSIAPGKHTLVLEITNNLVHQHQDRFSTLMQITPSGLIGPVKVIEE
ncbi:MAG: glycosyl transferase family 2 [Clostridia bacterium]|nr:glycosyl transferase family 2 [Clostridia bacterium]